MSEGITLLVPDPWIDAGVQQIGDQVGEDDTEDRGKHFIQQDSWCFREASASGIPGLAPGPAAENAAMRDLTLGISQPPRLREL